MPISYHVHGQADPFFITPCPFINLNKNYIKTGNGEIIGVTYNITLTGTLVANHGSPLSNGAFALTGDDDVDETKHIKFEASKYSKRPNTTKYGNDGGQYSQAWTTTITDASSAHNGEIGLDKDDGPGTQVNKWYKSLQVKQMALANLFSKKNEGGELFVDAYGMSGDSGFKCYPRIVSIDLPAHPEGNTYVAQYTINLEADFLIGPTSGALIDQDDFTNKWLITGASESYDISEGSDVVIERVNFGNAANTGREQDDSDTTLTNNLDTASLETISRTYKTFTVSRQISANGKNKFEFTNTPEAEGFLKPGTGSEDHEYAGEDWLAASGVNFRGKEAQNFAKKYDSPAWEQARGFVTDIIGHGLNPLNNKLDLQGVSIPSGYAVFNYSRSQSVDKMGGAFSVSESYLLAPSGVNQSNVTETIDISVEEGQDNGLVSVSINGSVQGLVKPVMTGIDGIDANPAIDNGDATATNFGNPSHTQDAIVSDALDLQEGSAADFRNKEFTNAGIAGNNYKNSKYEEALSHFNGIQQELYLTAQHMANQIACSGVVNHVNNVRTARNIGKYGGGCYILLNPRPVSKSVATNPTTGTITYNYSFNNRPINLIPNTRSENITISDNYPGNVYASQGVIGRKIGPVLQNIGTQTEWKRTLNIDCTVDVGMRYQALTENTISNSIKSTNASTRAGYGPTQANRIHDITTNLTEGTNTFSQMMVSKPSNNGDVIGKIKGIIDAVSPKGQNGVRKYYVDPPSESWNPKTGSWSWSISWTYEMDVTHLDDSNMSQLQYPVKMHTASDTPIRRQVNQPITDYDTTTPLDEGKASW